MINWSINKQTAVPICSNHSEDGVVDWKGVGRIYEHLACYYLSSAGFKAEIKDAAGYDLLCECPSGKFFKVEVKSSSGKLLAACSSRNKRTSRAFCFNGIQTKSAADLFMFFDRKTNHMVVKTRDEMGDLKDSIEISPFDFSEYQTNHHLLRIKSFIGSDDNAYIFPTKETELRLNRGWVRDNMEIVEDLKDRGVLTSAMSKMFGSGDCNWIRRMLREHRGRISGILK